MLGRLKETQLEGLVRALETRGGEPGPCCPVPANQRPGLSDQSEAGVMARVFRGWPDDQVMVTLPWCYNEEPSLYICCNPFHWSRVCHTGEQQAIRSQRHVTQNVDRQYRLGVNTVKPMAW